MTSPKALTHLLHTLLSLQDPDSWRIKITVCKWQSCDHAVFLDGDLYPLSLNLSECVSLVRFLQMRPVGGVAPLLISASRFLWVKVHRTVREKEKSVRVIETNVQSTQKREQ